MGLITKSVKVKWNAKNKKHYEELGYIYTKIGDEFEVKVEDLTKGSNVKVEYICDNCGDKKSITFNNYNRVVKEDRKTYCNKCSILLYGVKNQKRTKLSKSKSFYDWCVENNRQDVLDRWDYELNNCSPKDISYGSKISKWFKCLKHTEHKSELKNINCFTNGEISSIECNQCNSIGQYIIDNYGQEFLWKVWSDKNNISPFDISFGSHKKVWWNCLDNKHGDYTRECCVSIICKFRCPKCYEPLKGENHPNWNKDISQEEREKGRLIQGYSDFINNVYERDNYTCQVCSKHGGDLQVHHLNGYNWCKEGRTDTNNGVTLCKKCHKEFHDLYGRGNNTKEQFEEFLKEKHIDK